MKCPKCNEEIDDRTNYCPYCGEETAPKVCPKCRQQYSNKKFSFCPDCGTKLVSRYQMAKIGEWL